mmetsp:Transcript_10007/g.37882  ORF Transcript_10007/g.37882 Transcript_10007/m.37882 type:complete len:438 (-) Transcript_10007:478-1791(-)
MIPVGRVAIFLVFGARLARGARASLLADTTFPGRLLEAGERLVTGDLRLVQEERRGLEEDFLSRQLAFLLRLVRGGLTPDISQRVRQRDFALVRHSPGPKVLVQEALLLVLVGHDVLLDLHTLALLDVGLRSARRHQSRDLGGILLRRLEQNLRRNLAVPLADEDPRVVRVRGRLVRPACRPLERGQLRAVVERPGQQDFAGVALGHGAIRAGGLLLLQALLALLLQPLAPLQVVGGGGFLGNLAQELLRLDLQHVPVLPGLGALALQVVNLFAGALVLLAESFKLFVQLLRKRHALLIHRLGELGPLARLLERAPLGAHLLLGLLQLLLQPAGLDRHPVGGRLRPPQASPHEESGGGALWEQGAAAGPEQEHAAEPHGGPEQQEVLDPLAGAADARHQRDRRRVALHRSHRRPLRKRVHVSILVFDPPVERGVSHP